MDTRDFSKMPVEIIYDKLEPYARREKWSNWAMTENHLKSIGFSLWDEGDVIWVADQLPYREATIRYINSDEF